MPAFLPGLDLAQSFYEQEVSPRLEVVHSAALLGPGSDVLGYDDVRSTDHYWGPRLQVFVGEPDVDAAKRAIEALPATHLAWPTNFGSDNIPFRKHVDVWTISQWCTARLGVDPRLGLSAFDWLALPQQLLLETTAGRVFHDGLGQLEAIRESLACIRTTSGVGYWRPIGPGWRRRRRSWGGRRTLATTSGHGWLPPGSCATSCGCASS